MRPSPVKATLVAAALLVAATAVAIGGFSLSSRDWQLDRLGSEGIRHLIGLFLVHVTLLSAGLYVLFRRILSRPPVELERRSIPGQAVDSHALSTVPSSVKQPSGEAPQPVPTPPPNARSLSDQIRNRIATEVLRRTVPAFMLTLTLSLIMVWMGGREHRSRLITIAIPVVALAVVWWLLRTGRVAGAAKIFVALLCLAVLIGMILNGGTQAPAFVGTIPVLAIIGWLYCVRPAAAFLIGVVVTGGLVVWMDHQGWLRHVPAPTPVMIWIAVSAFLVLAFCATALPNRLLHRALADSEARRFELEVATHELIREKAFSDAMLFGLPGLVCLYDDQRCLVRWNARVKEVSGYSDEELKQGRIGMWTPEEQKARVMAAIEQVMREGRAETEAEVILKSGERRPFFYSGVRMVIEGRLYLLTIGLDITNRLKAEEALRHEQALTDAAFDNAPGIVVLYDQQLRPVRWNAKAQAISGFSPEELAQRAASDQHQGGDRASIDVTLEEALREGHADLELDLITKSGQRIPFYYSVVRLVLGGKPHALALGVDVTERKRAEEHLRHALQQAEAASRAKDQFLAAASHELRTPLTPVLLLTSSLEADAHLPAEARHDLAVIREHVEVERRLIGDLLDFSAIHAGKLQIHPVPTDVHDVLHAAVRTCQDGLNRKGLRLVVRLEAQHHRTRGDPDRLRQVFWNLLQNACKFTPEQGTVTVRTSDDGDGHTLRVEVSDTGIGMNPETLRRLFQPFEQGPRDEGMPHYGGLGLGLGLAITKALVEAHGGSISATSEGTGRGSTFIVRLPVTTAAPPLESPAGPQLPKSERVPLRLLLVEDHPLTLKTLSRLLAAEGHDVTATTTVDEALRAASRGRFDLVLSDIGLPDGSGLALMQTLRDRHGLTGIALSGFGADKDVDASRRAGFLAHLTKPVTIEALREVLGQFAATMRT